MKTVVKYGGGYHGVVAADESPFLFAAVVGIAVGAATIAARSWRVVADESPFLVVAVVGIAVGAATIATRS